MSGLIGLQYISGKAYIFDENGHMQKSGWYTVDGDYFYLNDNGAGVVSCWRLGEDGKYRYLKADGRITVTPIMLERTEENLPEPRRLTDKPVSLMPMAC